MTGMTENERVKLIRKSDKVNLTMDKFGERLGVGKTAISKIEAGERSVTDQMRRSICREFHVNEEWLLTGKGDMFAPSLNSEISGIAQKYGLDEADQAMLLEYARLDPEDRQVIKNYLRKTFLSLQETGTEESSGPETIDGLTREEYHAKIDSEFDARKKRETAEGSAEEPGIA